MQPIGADARSRSAWTGVAGDIHQRLQIHYQGTGALTGHDGGHPGCTGITEEQLTGIPHFRQTSCLHLKQAQFMGGTKTIFHRT